MSKETIPTDSSLHYSVGAKGRAPSSPYRAEGKAAEELARIRSISSLLGGRVENCILLPPHNLIGPDEKDLVSSFVSLREDLASLYDLKPSHADLINYYSRELYAEDAVMGDNFIPIQYPENKKYKDLFLLSEKLFDRSFIGIYQENVVGKVLGLESRYIAEATIAAVKTKLFEMPNSNGLSFPNYWVNGGNVQFDMMNLSPSHGYTQDSKVDFEDIMVSDIPWSWTDVKTLFRVRFVTGIRKIKEPFTWDYNQIAFQLGKLRHKRYLEDGRKTFNYPKAVTVLYVRGVLPNIEKTVRIDSTFLARIVGYYEEYSKKHKSTAETTTKIAEIVERDRLAMASAEKRSFRDHQKRIASSAIGTNSLEQKSITVFENVEKVELPKRVSRKSTKKEKGIQHKMFEE